MPAVEVLPGLRGLVLVGGGSVRMGRDKAALRLGGESLLCRTARLAGRFCEEVWVSGRDPASVDPAAASLVAGWLPDPVRGVGPLAGLVAGLRALGGPLLILPCDLPLMDAPILARLVAARRHDIGDCLVTQFLQSYTGYVEALVSIYEAGALPYMERALESGDFRLRLILPEASRRLVSYDKSESAAFLNCNRPEDLAMLAGLGSVLEPPDEE